MILDLMKFSVERSGRNVTAKKKPDKMKKKSTLSQPSVVISNFSAK
ncbi:MAG: hypothetical protein IKR09_07780 [Alphaproteobacteria bacterium]|nr:hypothetical protein [Alphaproteobacteria bacterium]